MADKNAQVSGGRRAEGASLDAERVSVEIPFDLALYDRLKALVGAVDVDLDGPLSPDDD